MRFKLIVTGLSLFAVLLCNALELNVQKDKTGNFVLENQFIRAAISAKGGKIVIFEDKIRQMNYALSTGSWAGLGKVRIFEDRTCTEFLDENYKVKILQNSGDKVTVECSYLAKRKDHPWRGFEVIKRYSLKKGENRLCMEWIINSYSNSGKLTPFMHNYLRIRNKSYAFAQTADGLFCREIRAANSRERTRMVRNLSEPWGAVVSPETGSGILGCDALDSTKEMLFWLDESKPTFEPVFETARFGMNSSWSNTYWFAPLRPMTAIFRCPPATRVSMAQRAASRSSVVTLERLENPSAEASLVTSTQGMSILEKSAVKFCLLPPRNRMPRGFFSRHSCTARTTSFISSSR